MEDFSGAVLCPCEHFSFGHVTVNISNFNANCGSRNSCFVLFVLFPNTNLLVRMAASNSGWIGGLVEIKVGKA